MGQIFLLLHEFFYFLLAQFNKLLLTLELLPLCNLSLQELEL